MAQINTLEELEALFDAPVPTSLAKVKRRITPLYRRWIEASRFCILSTVGPEGTDASPRGDDGPVVKIAGDTTLLLPDWRGNNRLDSLRNIVVDGRVSLMFMVNGSTNVVRVNGRAMLSTDTEHLTQFMQAQNHPKVVMVMQVEELYFQCAKAILRSKLWQPDGSGAQVPSAGDFIRAVDESFDAEDYDKNYEERTKSRMW